MVLRSLTLGVLLCASAAGSVFAQTAVPQVSQKRTYEATLNLRTFYDDNIARSDDARAQARGVDPQDTVFQPSVDLNIAQPLGRQILFLNGSAGYDFHRNNPRLDGERLNLTGGYAAALRFCQPMAYGSYRAHQAELDSPDAGRVDNIVKSTAVAVSAQCARGPGLGFTVTGSREDIKNSVQFQRQNDATVTNLAVQGLYGNDTVGRVGLVYTYTENELPNRIIPGRPVGDGFFTNTYGVTLDREFGSRINVTGTYGRTIVKREFSPPGIPTKFTANTYEAAIEYRPSNRLRVSLTGSRQVRPSDQVGKLLDINTIGDLSVGYDLGTRINVTLGAGIRDQESPVTPELAGRVITDSRVYSLRGSVAYRLGDHIRLSMDVNQDDRTANLPEFNYISNRIGLTVQLRY